MIWDIALVIVLLLFLIFISAGLIKSCVCKYHFDCRCWKSLLYRTAGALSLWFLGIIFLYLLFNPDGCKIDDNYVPLMNRVRKDIRIQVK